MEDYRPKSFIPLPPIEENESVQVIKDLRDTPQNPRQSYTVHEALFISDLSESFEYALSTFKEEMKETKCLRKAMLIYMALLNLNCMKSDYSRAFHFVMYYPTIVGWIYIFAKVRTLCDFMDSQKSHKMQKTSSDETLCTISSDDDLSSHTDMDNVEVKEQIVMQKITGDHSMIESVSVDGTPTEPQEHSNPTTKPESKYGEISRIIIDEDYGYFVTFLDEEPRKPEIPPLTYQDEATKPFYQRVRETITPYL